MLVIFSNTINRKRILLIANFIAMYTRGVSHFKPRQSLPDYRPALS